MRPAGLGLARDEWMSPWTPVFTSFVAAEVAAFLFCGLPPVGAQGIPSLAVRAVVYVGATFAGGALGALLPMRLLGRRPRPGLGALALVVSPGWLLLPVLAVLFREGSVLLLPLTGVAAWITASGLERLSSLGAVGMEVRNRTFLGAVYGLPGPEFHPATKFLIAGSVMGAALFGSAGFLPFASLLLAGGVFLLLWRWRALTQGRGWRIHGGAGLLRLSAAATLATFLVLVLWRAGVVHGPGLRPARRSAGSAVSREGAGGTGYLGIVLLPPEEKKKQEISSPVSRSAQYAGLREPVVIRFDGPYWYFQAPADKPGNGAHVAHGRATEVNVRSTDGLAIRMMAHQSLGSEVRLDCCSELVVSVTNAEDRAGEIALGLILTDSASPGKNQTLFLGQQTLPASLLSEDAPVHRPVMETLHFPIPRSAKLSQFDQIDVIYAPSMARARTGTKVGINSFTLIPR